jgi:fumarylpyruvate hydrolase
VKSNIKASNLKNIFCLGRNFECHAKEMNSPIPERPIWFNKLPSIFIGHNDAIILPEKKEQVYESEAEVAILISKALYKSNTSECEKAIESFSCAQDITARTIQRIDKKNGNPWLRSKNIKTFGVLGPQWQKYPGWNLFKNFTLSGWRNNKCHQKALLNNMIFSPAKALAEISHWHPINPGDVLFLGTPAGVGAIFPGDTLEVRCDDLKLQNVVI